MTRRLAILTLLTAATLSGCAGVSSRQTFPDCTGCMFERRRP